MITAPIPPDDEHRLQALRELLILDTPPEARFDRVVHFAAAEFDMPIVLVSLVDHKRQWFKARVGLDVREVRDDEVSAARGLRAPQVAGDPERDCSEVDIIAREWRCGSAREVVEIVDKRAHVLCGLLQALDHLEAAGVAL